MNISRNESDSQASPPQEKQGIGQEALKARRYTQVLASERRPGKVVYIQ
jgi:hypothetical protein